jgi:hypothetical protein
LNRFTPIVCLHRVRARVPRFAVVRIPWAAVIAPDVLVENVFERIKDGTLAASIRAYQRDDLARLPAEVNCEIVEPLEVF